jgi:hypothetical protein
VGNWGLSSGLCTCKADGYRLSHSSSLEMMAFEPLVCCSSLPGTGDPCLQKITRAKWTGGVAQAVLCLLCKCEALSSNPSPTKKESESNQKKRYQLNPKTADPINQTQ